MPKKPAWWVVSVLIMRWLDGEPGSVAIRRISSVPYASECFITPLSTVARVATELKNEYINEAGNDVTQAWLDYVAPLVGELPQMGKLI